MTAMQPRSRQEAEMLGLPAWQIDTMFPPATGGGLLGGFGPETQGAIDEYAAMDGLLAAPAPDRFWQGGKKFGVKDGIAGLLAAAGDALMAQAGMGGGAVQGLLGGRSEALDEFKKQAAQEAKLRELIALGAANNIPENVVRAQAAGLDLPEQEKPHELQRLAALANDPTQPADVRDAAKRKLQDDPYLTGVNLPNGGQFFGRASALPGVSGSMGGGGLTPMTPEEIKAMGLPEGGPGGNRPGRFPVR